MRQLFGKGVLLFICLCFTAFPVMAWDDVGHQITAYIAWQQMTPQTREAVVKILRSAPEDSQLSSLYVMYGAEPEQTRKLEFFMIAATWADIVRDREFPNRNKKYHKGNWHYSDTFWKQVDGKNEILSGFPEGGQGVVKLFEFDKVLRDAKSTDEQKALAIAWIMHIGGDLHQPLHTSARVTDVEPKGDQGGNLFLLSPQGTKREDQLNLHWYWDSIVNRNIPLKGDSCDRQYIEMLAKKMMKKYPFAKDQGKLELGKYDDWQKESFVLNQTDVFSADLKRNQIPSEKYKKRAFNVAESQLALAGYRLGATLNSIFAAK